jgi:predicted signal transduction protein with EAL and GGDEF domain
MDRVRKWAFGEYTLLLEGGKKPTKVNVHASVGIAQWQAGETMARVIERADIMMYSDKKLSKSQHA